jgi:hypothetical protein
MTLHWETDSGHGWLKVGLLDLLKSGADKNISACSYLDKENGIAYLEEDCDAGKYLRAIGLKPEDNLECIDNYTDGSSFVRGLPRFQA